VDEAIAKWAPDQLWELAAPLIPPAPRRCAVARVTPNIGSGSFHHEQPA
jgi:hypothetical protein